MMRETTTADVGEARARQDDREVVAAEPAGDVAPAQRLAQGGADLAQRLVAGRVAEQLVDALHAVDVEDDQRRRVALRPRRRVRRARGSGAGSAAGSACRRRPGGGACAATRAGGRCAARGSSPARAASSAARPPPSTSSAPRAASATAIDRARGRRARPPARRAATMRAGDQAEAQGRAASSWSRSPRGGRPRRRRTA